MSESNPEQNSEPKPELRWEERRELKINTQLRDIIMATKAVAEEQLVDLRKKLEKLQYGG